jgi:hypothetical protein
MLCLRRFRPTAERDSILSVSSPYFRIYENPEDVMQEIKDCVFSSADLQRKLHV